MRTLLVVPKYSLVKHKTYSYVFPLGLAYISASLKRAGYDVDCINLNHTEGNPLNALRDQLSMRTYDVVGTGSISINYHITEAILNTVKSHPSRPKTILGGPIVTTAPETIFNALKPDIGVIGEGEETIVELFRRNLSHDVAGIITKDGMTQPRKPPDNLDTLPFPDVVGLGYEERLENVNASRGSISTVSDFPRSYVLITSRSCPFQCTFCWHTGRYRQRSIDNVMEEIESVVRKYRIDFLDFSDDCFGFDKQKLLDFCSRLKRFRDTLDWELESYVQLIVTIADDEVLSALKSIGCHTVCFGFESYSPKVLKSMNKHITPEQMDSALKKTLAHKMTVAGYFIFGDPAETLETARETIDYWKTNSKGQIGLDFVQPYPGSKLFQYCLERGLIKDELDFIKHINPRKHINMTSLTDKEFSKLHDEVLQLNQTYFKNDAIALRQVRTGKDVYSVTVRCPYCNTLVEYNNMYLFAYLGSNKYVWAVPVLCRTCFMKFRVTSRLFYYVYARYQPIASRILIPYLRMSNYFREHTMRQVDKT
jgi:anaerobic magnesium-protoporphyrin IX monomethyl ester cyclase